MTEKSENSWHLDKKVPIALIFAILAQTFTFGWWSATMTARVDQLEKQVTSAAPQAERIVRLEAKMDSIAEAISDLKILMRRPQN